MSVNFAPYQPLASLVDVIGRYLHKATSDMMRLERKKKNMDFQNAKLSLDHHL